MRVASLSLQHIRLHRSFFIALDHPTTVIVGSNASGKTTLIESVYLLATGSSFRAEKIEEMIGFDQELGRVKGVVQVLAESASADEEEKSETAELEVLLTRGEVQGRKTARRLYTVNGVRKRKADATALLQAVVFRPEDMRLVEGSPARRRSFMDSTLSGCYPEYARALKTYEQTLRRRNKLLTQVREGEQPRTTLHYWNTSLVSAGTLLQQHRRNFLQSFSGVEFPLAFTSQYQPSVITEARIAEYLPREVAAGHTLIGPHKDDFVVKLPFAGERRSVATFGSRGQQRMAVLWLKFGEFGFIQQVSGHQPVLLLDDILSELDEQMQTLALAVVAHCQSLITTTDPAVEHLLKSHLPKNSVGVEKLS